MSDKEKKVSLVVVKRLPRYYRYLRELLSRGVSRVSSRELSLKMGVTASQIRQDLNCFGGFGQQGYGYNVEQLCQEIGTILGLDRGYKTIIIGAGNLGHALANHTNFAKRGFTLIGIFDSDPNVAGGEINGIKVRHADELADFVKEHNPEIAILAVPKAAVNRVANELVALGVRGLWNFSYTELSLPDSVAVENVHLSDSLMTLSYKFTNLDSGDLL
ncbi:MAG: redox-sensing transcriptional repressor Rex [Ruminococcaceae bacterium]|nr:redox-sensing transcriptional repressor Rex [Oscillospiraceae bacterium]